MTKHFNKRLRRAFSSAFLSVVVTTAMATFTPVTYAQESLIDLIRSGQQDAAIDNIVSGSSDVNAVEADGSTALLWATYTVNHDLVRALLDKGAKADITNRFGSTPLAEAVKLTDIELVRLLLDAGADPDSPNLDQQTALMLASHLGSLEIAEMLLEKGAKVNVIESFRGQTALMWAASENHPAIAELLIKAGADVSIKATHDDWPRQMTSEPRAQFRPTGGLTALLYATRSGCYRCAVSIVEAGANIDQANPDGVTPLINALDNKSFDIAMYLIDQGAKIDVWDMTGRTPIYLAIDMNSFTPRFFSRFIGPSEPRGEQTYTAMDVATRLMEAGVDVNHQLTRMRPNGPGRGRFADYDMRGGTGPLMVATLSDDHEAIESLLAHGAEVDLRNVFRITPLMAAAGMSGTGRGSPTGPGVDHQAAAIKTIDLLLAAGADINAQITQSRTLTAKLDTYVQGRNNEGRTALHAAAELGWERVVAYLIEKGADASLVSAEGKTALDQALTPITTGGPGRQDTGDRKATAALLSGLKISN